MVQDEVVTEATIRAALDKFCDQSGGGAREIRLGPGRYGGFYIKLIWDGFASSEVAGRQVAVLDALEQALGDSTSHVVRNLNLLTPDEAERQDVLANALSSSWPPRI